MLPKPVELMSGPMFVSSPVLWCPVSSFLALSRVVIRLWNECLARDFDLFNLVRSHHVRDKACHLFSWLVLSCAGMCCFGFRFLLYCLVSSFLVSFRRIFSYCVMLPCLVSSCVVLSCLVLCCVVLSCLVLSCLDLTHHILYCFLMLWYFLSLARMSAAVRLLQG